MKPISIWSPLANGRPSLHVFTGISNCREIQCAARALRSTVNWPMVRRNVVGSASRFRHDLNNGETGKGGPLWGLNPSMPVWPNHGVFGVISWWFRTNSWCFEIMSFSWFWGPETASPTGQAHHTLVAAAILKTQKTSVFWGKRGHFKNGVISKYRARAAQRRRRRFAEPP